jgi:hypothetical protein
MEGKRYIIEGRAVDKVIRENRIRISRGDIIVTPCDEVAEAPEGDAREEAPEVPGQPKAPETEKEQEQQPVAPEVPETDSKEPAAESDAKAAPEGEDNKKVTADADSKDSQVVDEKEPAQEEPKKSTRNTKK